MTPEQEQLLMSVYAKLIKLRDIGQVTDNVHIRDLSNDGITDLLCLRNDLYYLSDDCSTKGEDGGDEGFNEFVKENYK